MAKQELFVTKEPVQLEGYQAILKPSEYGYTLSAIVDGSMIDRLEEDRVTSLKWAESKLTNPKRSSLKPEPWVEVGEDRYKLKFTWKEDNRPPIVDSEGTPVTDDSLAVWSGSTVKLAFRQKAYVLKDGITFGTSVKLAAIQIVSLANQGGMDTGSMKEEDVIDLFGKTSGFVYEQPNVTANAAADACDDF